MKTLKGMTQEEINVTWRSGYLYGTVVPFTKLVAENINNYNPGPETQKILMRACEDTPEIIENLNGIGPQTQD
jgi:hypothetical protein